MDTSSFLTLLAVFVLVFWLVIVYNLRQLENNTYSDQMKRKADELARGKRD